MNARQANPWAALGALCLGFFMILLDTTIVSIAIPTMLRELNAGLNSIVWVISVYLLTYAVPMLFTSRLGDRFGPRTVYLAGLAVFGDRLGDDPLVVGVRIGAFALILVGAALIPAPGRAGEALEDSAAEPETAPTNPA